MKFKFCPQCGSRNIDWIIPQNWSFCMCKDCSYSGPVIEGNEKLMLKIVEDYKNNEKIEENDNEDIEELSDEELDEKLDELFKKY